MSRLLDRMSDFVVAGTLGSYETMKDNRRKDIDYVLVPPGVWDVLYEMYSGWPPPPSHGPSASTNRDSRCCTFSHIDWTGDSKHMEFGDESGTEVEIYESDVQFMRIPESFAVATHPWILHCSFAILLSRIDEVMRVPCPFVSWQLQISHCGDYTQKFWPDFRCRTSEPWGLRGEEEPACGNTPIRLASATLHLDMDLGCCYARIGLQSLLS
jgi:hypothetical protein